MSVTWIGVSYEARWKDPYAHDAGVNVENRMTVLAVLIEELGGDHIYPRKALVNRRRYIDRYPALGVYEGLTLVVDIKDIEPIMEG